MDIGIDLGTTFSVAAFVNSEGKAEVIENREGKSTTPSVVLFESDGKTVVIGEIAKENILLQPENVISHVKDVMGTRKKFKTGDGKEYSPEEISALILRKIIQDSENTRGEKAGGAVITIPAYFNDAQRKATQDAAALAGIRVLRMINEPTAAALCFAQNENIGQGNIMVYDLGGGTFDVSVVRISGKTAQTVATGGIRKMGGHFFDQLIMNQVTDYLEETHGLDLYEDGYLDELQELALKAENAKLQLSSIDKTDIIVKIGKVKERIAVRREDFEKKIEKHYLRTEAVMNMVLADAGMKYQDLDYILLVGGSSKIPFIQQKIRAVSGMIPSTNVNPDEAVALGAAYFADFLRQEMKAEKPAVVDVCSHSLGVVTMTSDTRRRVNSVVISRNSSLPVTQSKIFYTSMPDQRVLQLEVTEGEGRDLEYVSIITDFKISLPTGLRDRTPVEIRLQLDEDQLLHVFTVIEQAGFTEECRFERLQNKTGRELTESEALISDIEVE